MYVCIYTRTTHTHPEEGAGKRAGGRAEPSVGREGGWEGKRERLLGWGRGGAASGGQ